MFGWFDTLFSSAVPDVLGILVTVPAVALYIRGSVKKRFCANCQQPIGSRRRKTTTARNVDGLIVIEASK